MAKELPYFRFTVSEWLQDDISLESYEMKGVFIDVCAYYWFKDCNVSLATLNKRFSNAKALVQALINLEIIKIIDDDFIKIKFLDEQYDLLSEKRKKYVEAGRLGGLRRASNAKAMLKQRSSYKDKDNNKDNNKDKKDKKNIGAKKFIPPTKEEVIKYFQERGYRKDVAIRAWNYYEAGNWHDSSGKPVKSWKQKMISVWFKPENESPKRTTNLAI